MYSCVRCITYLSTTYLLLYVQIYEFCNTAGTHWTHKSKYKYSNWIKLYSYCLSIIRCITDNDCGLHKIKHCLFNATFTNSSVISSGWQVFFFGGWGLGAGRERCRGNRNKFVTGNRRIGALHLQITLLTLIVLCTDIYTSNMALKFDQCIC